MKKYLIPGKPTAWQRVNPYGGRPYDTQKSLKFDWGIDLHDQHGDDPLFKGPLHLEAYFYFPIAKTIKPAERFKRKGSYHSFRPDLSNLVKLIEDVATGILYEDDSLIASITAYKLYDDRPRTEFSLRELLKDM